VVIFDITCFIIGAEDNTGFLKFQYWFEKFRNLSKNNTPKYKTPNNECSIS
jgi:hypothetical protein